MVFGRKRNHKDILEQEDNGVNDVEMVVAINKAPDGYKAPSSGKARTVMLDECARDRLCPKLTIHEEEEEETKDAESFDPIAKTPGNSDDKGNDDENLGLNVGSEEGQHAKDDEDKLYIDVNINLEGRDVQMTDVHTTQEFEDTHVTLTPTTSHMDVPAPTTVASLTLSAPNLTPPTIPTISIVPQAPTPPTTAPSTLLQDLPNFGSLFGFDHRLKTLEANFSEFSDRLRDEAQAENEEFLKNLDENIQKIIKEQVKVQVSKILPKIEKTVNEQLEAEVLTRSSNSSKTSYDVAADLSEMELKKILIEKMESNKDVVMMMRTKMKNPPLDQTEGPRGEEKEKSQSQQALQRRKRPGPLAKFKTCAADDQPIAEASQHPEWFQQQKKPPTPDRAWNKTLPATHESIQPWISDLAKQADSRSSFNELMDTPVDFSAFLMNRLKVDTLTPKLLAGPTYELMKGSCKSFVELEFFLEEVYKATTDQESARDVYSKRRIIAVTELQIVEWHNYKHLDWITVCRDDDKLYKFKEGDFKRLRIQDIEDMLLLLLGVESYQKKLNLTKPDTYHSDLKRKEAYTAYSNPRGFIYQNKDMQNRLMRIDELHKFSDGTLNDVRTALDDRLRGIRMMYLPQAIWRKSDKERASAIIWAIDKQLKTRRIMRSLKKFFGGRLYEGDFRMLQRTI
nr:hypothetical protein CTI12_AA557910 [Tanacetum cinerariifolium]